jgi:hypothetical protein
MLRREKMRVAKETYRALVGDPNFADGFSCPGVEESPGFVLEENNNRSCCSNCSPAVNVPVVTRWQQAPYHGDVRAPASQQDDLPGSLNLVGNHQLRVLVRRPIRDQNKGQRRFAVAIEINLDQAWAAIAVVRLEEPFVILLKIGQSDDLRPRVLGRDFTVQVLRQFTPRSLWRCRRSLGEPEQAKSNRTHSYRF